MSGPKKKSWTFLPERSRVPPNRRATQRQTTVRSFTYVQDWDPMMSPASSSDAARQPQSTSRGGGAHGTSSEGSIRESPIAQLMRASPVPIITARKTPAGSHDQLFKSPRAPSPSSSVSSQSSSRSQRKPSARQQNRNEERSASSRNENSVEDTSHSSQETGVRPSLPSSQTRERHSSGSTIRSPAPVIASQRASTPRKSDASRSELSHGASIQGNLNDSEISRVPLRGSASPDRRERSSGEQSSPPTSEGYTSPNKDSLVTHAASASSSDKQGGRTSSSSVKQSRRKRRVDVLTFRKKSAKIRTDSTPNTEGSIEREENSVGSGAASSIITQKSPEHGSSGSRTLRKKRRSDLTFRKKHRTKQAPKEDVRKVRSGASPGADIRQWARPSVSGSGGSQSDSTSSSQQSTARQRTSGILGQGSSGSKGQRRRQKKSELSNTEATSDRDSSGELRPARDAPQTPADKSVSLIAQTPKSGHVSRHLPRSQLNRPEKGSKEEPKQAKGKQASTSRKRSQKDVPAEEESPTNQRAKVRLWMTGARPRLVTDTTDLDIVLNDMEDTTEAFREALSSRGHKRAVSEFFKEARQELTNMITLQQELKLQTAALTRTRANVRRYKQEHLGLEKKILSLDSQIAAAKKRQEMTENSHRKDLERMSSFLTDLQDLHEKYRSKYPTDIKKLKYDSQNGAEGAVADLKSSLESLSTLRVLNDRLEEWLDGH